MRLPSPDEYQSAIQNPRIAFSDSELKACSVERDPLGLPRPLSGGFAVIYHLHGQKHHWAVRCFYREISHLTRRYEVINRFLAKNADAIFVDAKLLHNGILVRGQWYPTIKMPWIDGDPLNVYVEKNISKPNRLSWLVPAYLDLVRNLEKIRVAHGDLQHGNIMVSNQTLRLVDYDGLYLPELAGLPNNQIGHINYQHPLRNEQHFDLNIDRFSEIVIYLALRAIVEKPALWRKYSSGGENLLFVRNDFIDPQDSPLLADLEKIPNLEDSVKNFRSMCYLEIDAIPTLENFIAGQVPVPKVIPKPREIARPPIAPHIPVTQYETIEADDLAALLNRVGHRVQVVGRITDYHKGFTRDKKQPYMFLNFGDWKKGCFMLVAWKETLDLLSSSGIRVSEYKGKWVSVTGVLTQYKGRPQMQVTIPSQIEILPIAEDVKLRVRKGSRVRATPIMTVVPRTTAPPRSRVSTPVSRETIVLQKLYGAYPARHSRPPVTQRGRRPAQFPHVPIPTTSSRRLARIAFNALIISVTLLSSFYTSQQLSLFPVIVTRFRVDTTTITQSRIVASDVILVGMTTRTTMSTSTTTFREDESVVVVSITIQSLATSTYRTHKTAWFQETITITTSFETTKIQTLAERSPPLALALFAGSLVGAFALTRTNAFSKLEIFVQETEKALERAVNYVKKRGFERP